jgi:hypothetical protein
MICPTAKAEYFFGWDWTGRIALIRFVKFGFRRNIRTAVGPYSSGSTLTIEAPWLLPAQKVTGVVELSTNTRLMLVLRGSR